MDKELKEKLNSLLNTVIDTLADKIGEMSGACEEAITKPCKIHIDSENGNTKLEVEGGRLSLLLTLAGAEKSILRDLKCSKEEFELIKNMVGSEEVNRNE